LLKKTGGKDISKYGNLDNRSTRSFRNCGGGQTGSEEGSQLLRSGKTGSTVQNRVCWTREEQLSLKEAAWLEERAGGEEER